MNLVERVKKAADVRQILDRYGAQRIRGTGHIRSTCVLHGGNNPSALVFDEIEKLWYCHTGCQTGGSVIDFVMIAEKCEFQEAVEILAEMFDIEIDWENDELNENYFVDSARDFIKAQKQREEAKELLPLYETDDERLRVNKFRNFTPEVINHYGLQVARSGELNNRLTLPLEDRFGRVVGYSGRRIKADMKAKWMHKPNGLPLGRIVPGIGLNLGYIVEKMEVILVEGPFDSMRLWERGYKNVAQVMGANITDEQVKEVQKVAFSVVLGYDNDMAGRNATRKAIKKFQSNSDVTVLLLPKDKDPCDLNEKEMKEAYEKRIKPYEFYEMYGKNLEKRGMM